MEAERTKGDHSRTVFIGERLPKEIGAYFYSSFSHILDVPLFSTQKRRGFTANTLCQTLNTIYRGAGIHDATSHSGRRTFITTLATKGIGVRVLASLAGHRHISTTQQYIDVNDKMKRAAVELL